MGHVISTQGWWGVVIGFTVLAWLVLGVLPAMVKRRRSRLRLVALYEQTPPREPAKPASVPSVPARASSPPITLREAPVKTPPTTPPAAPVNTPPRARPTPLKTPPAPATHQRPPAIQNGAGLCSVCGAPGEQFAATQANLLCRKHWLQGMPNPIEFERMVAGRR